MNLNKLFPWLSIRYKLIIAFAGLSVLPVVLVSVWSIISNVQSLKQVAYENLTHDVHIIRDNTANFLTRVEGDMRILQHFAEFRRPIEGKGGGKATPSAAQDVRSFMASREIYYQIRLIDTNEDELLRIECSNPSDSLRHYVVSPRSSLRRGSERYYLLLTSQLHSGDVVLAPAEVLYKERERIPVISVAMPIDVRGRGRFILIADIFAKDFFTVVEADRHLDVRGKVIIATHDGHYLYHSEKKTDWNRLLAAREEDNLQHDYAKAVVSAVLSGQEGIVTEGSSEIVSYAPLVETLGPGGTDVQPAFAMPFFVLESVPTNLILGPARSFAETFAVFLGVFLVVAVGLGLLATRQFTRPIGELERGAAIISQGEYSHRLSVETHDEIERLAQQFNVMAASLEEREKEIRRHRETLEETVRSRTKELTEEKTKLQAILDNIPSAFILLDGNYRIQTTSAAFSSVMGFPAEDVLNRDCATLLCGRGFCHHCVARAAVASGAIESHIDVIPGQSEGERYLEHIAIPMQTNGETGSIIEIITDITKRKQFEQRLMQAERLTAAGEMSAIIAHEFRNSLTSIKMILQLQRESKRLSRSDGKSLDVALHSIFHMEQVVTELLNFARPAPMQFREADIAPVIDECLEFVRLQMAKSHVTYEKKIDPALPAVRLDVSRFKEALINVLLNALQAIETKIDRSEREEISLRAERRILRRSMKQSTDLGERQEPGHNGSGEIHLSQGSHCLVIEVKDTGGGITRENMKRIFDPFFTTKVNGTGLGLPLVKRTINAHGGIVNIHSDRSGGTFVTMLLPLSREM